MHGTCLLEVRLLRLHEVPAAPGSEWHFCTGSLPGLDIVVNPDYRALFPRYRRHKQAYETPFFRIYNY